ncbi:hypothetical protein RDV89_19660 [Nocardioides zeae]|uniref:Bacterial spore germination immunoglobulin-like domain-containing protein n=1 Tax=Nocardioides imazamoxiresistens TaxID=3231893 RepID=A0ABU3Q1C0_9ACTN|nr:hypothetical protein [Nocardioides zeae]MDT9595314.1 hypothetical protein [Nocardioides zeae]
MDEAEDRPVLVGAIALVGVSLVIGLIVALVVLGGTRVAGLGGGSGGGGGGSAVEPTMTLPPITETELPASTISLVPEDTEGGDESAPAEPSETETTTEAADPSITLQVGSTSAGSMERIDVSGIYTGGDGAVLSIQRLTDGTWNDIASNAAVSNELFSTYIALGRPGENTIRAYDSAAELASNEVVVTIG